MRNDVVIRVLAFVVILAGNDTVDAQCHDVRVALDGSGDFTSVQAAIDAAPTDLTAPFVIYIAEGIYDEKLFIEKNFITLVGEDRDSTILTTAVLRRVWRENNPSDWGAATINIASDVTDLTLAHLTVRNNFADIFPDFPDNNDHTFAIRGGGHRVIIIDCNVVATGGDTVSLWNTDGGMFYHNACFFEGYVDYMAPRGYCYITDSEFFGYNSNASIWHDGSGGEDHKLVIRNSYFDGVQNFALGRHHRDAAFYLLDCDFSETMQNKGLYHTGSDPLQWGERLYYYNCHRPFFDWSWMWDNLGSAVGSPKAEDIDAMWTFGGEWDPESAVDGLLPQAFLPSPVHEAGCVEVSTELHWVPGHCVTEHLLYFGTDEDPPFVAATDTHVYALELLEGGQRYFWRVDEVGNMDTVKGTVWTFQTADTTGLPGKVYAPDPPNGSYFETNVIRLDWSYQTCNTDSFYVYYGTTPDALELQQVLKYPAYFRPNDDDDSTYYWRVDSKNEQGVTAGDVWSFTLNPTLSSATNLELPEGFSVLSCDPNPLSTVTSLRVWLPAPGELSVRVFDQSGRLVQGFPAKHYPSGEQTLDLTLKDNPTGIYVGQVEFKGIVDTVKLVVHR